MNRRAQGNDIEQSVCEYLISQGYKILARNYYTQLSELDIVAQEMQQIVFVEVKSVQSNQQISVFELLSRAKIRKLELAINQWLAAKDKLNCDWRLDYVGVLVNSKRQIVDIQHLKYLEL